MRNFNGASAILSNMRKNMPVTGSLDTGETLSSMLSNVSLSSYMPPKDGVVLASFKVATTNPNGKNIQDGITRLFGGELGVVEGSMKVLEKSKYFTSVSAHLTRNTVTRAVGEQIPTGFVSLSKNIFMEERDSKTWKLVTGSDGKRVLVRDNSVETDNDIEQLMASLSSDGHEYTQEAKKLQSEYSNMHAGLNVGVLLTYVSESSQHIGFVVEPEDNLGLIGIVGSNGYVSVSATKVVHTFDIAEYYDQLSLPKAEILSSRVDINTMIDYYKKVYGYNKDYLEKFLMRFKTLGAV